MASKGAVKAIKACIDKQEYQKAVDLAVDVTKHDPKNHTAFLFLGFAHEKLGNIDPAEKALSSAASLKPQDAQPLKGLVSLYEKQGSLKLDQYHQAVHQLARIYAEQGNREQCQNTVDKYELFAKKHGSQAQYRRALELILPDSDLYATLEGRVLSPALAYQRILESAQAEKANWIETQIAERRTRLGARIDQVTQDVKCEAIAKFQIDAKYEALIHWTRDDDVRHELEQQYFQRLFDDLTVLPADQKPTQRDRVLNIANGMVIIKQQFAPAWKVALEWVDAEDLGDWDISILSEYIDYFPDDGLSKVLRGFLDNASSPFPHTKTEKQSDEPAEAQLSEADQLILMSDGLDDCPQSHLAHRIMAHVFLHLEEYESAADTARKAQKLHHEAQRMFGLNLQSSIDGVNLTLANALIYYQSPRHHAESKSLFEAVLAHKPKLTSALLGVGLIYEEDEDYSEAAHFLERAAERDDQNLRILLELAWCKALSQDLCKGLEELQHILSALNAQEPINSSMKAEALYRIGYCKWHIESSAAARKNKNGPYKDLIDAVKANPSYAPAYTLLGIYFQDYGKSKQRARVALQKAFELSTSELQAAERLARLFADRGEWDLVELVAQRVINSGKAKPAPGSKKKALSWPFSAMGIVQINKQHYSNAIISFQAALRVHPGDYHSWVGLGESYHNSGRFLAASKAFEKAESLDHSLPPDQTWFAKYMLANVQKEMGDFDKSIEQYQLVLEIRNGEHGVLVALLQALCENAWSKIAQGMFEQAADLAATAIATALEIARQQVHTFNLWKAVGDACSALARVKAFAPKLDFQKLVQLLTEQATAAEFEILQDQDKAAIDALQDARGQSPDCPADKCLIAAIMAHKRAIHACAHDRHAQAVSWFNLGSAEHQAYVYAGVTLQVKGHQPRRFIKAAVRCFKRAIELEAGNSEFWNSLAVVTMTLNPKVSQHSFVRSLHLNDHSARTWTNLGALYLLHNDVQLANLAFTRAQSADPEYADAWIGQGLLATLHGAIDEARGLFTHAFEISDSGSLVSRRHYARSAFDHLLKASSNKSRDIARLLEPLFATRQLHLLSPTNVTVTHLMALYAERAGDYGSAIAALSQVCDMIEAEYEESESESTLVQFAQAKSDLARVQLANAELELAVDNAQTALALSEEESASAAFAEQVHKLRLSAHITAGLAYSRLKAIEQSIKMFQAALGESSGNPDVVCMLAQVLWAKGGQAEKEAAQSQLFDCVSDHPHHVRSILLLATIGLLDGDSDILDAVLDDLQGLLISDKVSEHDKIEVTKVITAINTCSAHDDEDASKAMAEEALRSIMLSPAQPHGWLQLAYGGNAYAADVAKANSLKQMPPNGGLEATDVSQAFANTGCKEDMDQAKMLAPWAVGSFDDE
ncbi:hypothetical protein DV737_g5557, partial [Chaetothyriales sp. CBS 132003]